MALLCGRREHECRRHAGQRVIGPSARIMRLDRPLFTTEFVENHGGGTEKYDPDMTFYNRLNPGRARPAKVNQMLSTRRTPWRSVALPDLRGEKPAMPR